MARSDESDDLTTSRVGESEEAHPDPGRYSSLTRSGINIAGVETNIVHVGGDVGVHVQIEPTATFEALGPADTIKFPTAPNARPDEVTLIAEVVILDHQSLNTFTSNSRARREVWGLLVNAVLTGVVNHHPEEGRRIFENAQSIYADHLNTANRLWYLFGLIVGTVVITSASIGVIFSPFGTLIPVDPRLLVGLILFAGMGALASVLGRLSSLDLVQERSLVVIGLSGAARPIVAIIFAIVVYLILSSKIVNVALGAGAGSSSEVYLLAAFLSGFSERFAQDIITSVPFGSTPSQLSTGRSRHTPPRS